MDEQNQRRIGHKAGDLNLRVMTGTAIDFVVSVVAIYVTMGALSNLFKRQYRSTSAPAPITKRVLAIGQQNEHKVGHETRDINLRAVTWTAIGLIISAIAMYVTVGGLFNLFNPPVYHHGSQLQEDCPRSRGSKPIQHTICNSFATPKAQN
jgi:hypothetical protein